MFLRVRPHGLAPRRLSAARLHTTPSGPGTDSGNVAGLCLCGAELRSHTRLQRRGTGPGNSGSLVAGGGRGPDQGHV